MRACVLLIASLLLCGCAAESTRYRVGGSGPLVGRIEAERQLAAKPVQVGGEAPLLLRAISTPMPPYPRDLVQSGIAGSVCVVITVQPDGSVSDPAVVDNPPPSLAAVVLGTVIRWKFVPASVDGRTGPIRGSVLVNFSIKE